jgi:hypothetical protein
MAKVPRARRRYLTFSLRTFFVLLTALAVWLGVVVNRAREQREAVKAIKAVGGHVLYDWQLRYGGSLFVFDEGEPAGPAWLRRVIGDEFFQDVAGVWIPPSPSESEFLTLTISLQRLKRIKFLFFYEGFGKNRQEALRAALPPFITISLEKDREWPGE